MAMPHLIRPRRPPLCIAAVAFASVTTTVLVGPSKFVQA